MRGGEGGGGGSVLRALSSLLLVLFLAPSLVSLVIPFALEPTFNYKLLFDPESEGHQFIYYLFIYLM